MKNWHIYAYINADGRIEAIEAFGGKSDALATFDAQIIFGDDAKAVEVTNFKVMCGDKYYDGAFWRENEDGTETKLEEVPSEEERIEAVESTSATNTTSIESNTTAIDDILVMLLDDANTTEATE